jgi:phosphohistidine phosphatase
MKRIARGLASMVSSFDIVGTSPLRRAVQTAELVCEAYGGRKALEIPELSPGGRPAAMVGWLGRQKRDASIALVGHEPDLAVLASWLMTGRKGSVVQLKKGAGCMLDLGDDPGAGKARLQWLLTPEQLTRLGR